MRLLLFLASLCLMVSVYAQDAPSFRVMSFNIRLNTTADGMNAWPHRRPMVESMIRFNQIDLLGVQEALPDQMEDLRRMLPDFAAHGIARDTTPGGEYSAIFYRRARFDLIEGGTFWLSETPDKMSKGWDAALNRIATWGRFMDKETGKQFVYLNTHFDHVGETARRESARLLLEKSKSLNPAGLPVILSGDLNTTPESEPYRILNSGLSDAYYRTRLQHHGPSSSWSGFTTAGEPGRRIDYIFVNDQVTVLRHAILSDSWSGKFPSDHLPVMAEVMVSPVRPLAAAHAHNDYEHKRPLWDALDRGFTSVEADIWLINNELYVSHTRPVKPDSLRTLRRLYLDPLSRRVSDYGGAVYPAYPGIFRLMIDIKNEGAATWEVLRKQLAGYDWLLRGEGAAVQVFISGDRPVETLLADNDRLAGVDGRPSDIGKGIPALRMPVISESYPSLVKWKGTGAIPPAEMAILVDLCKRAHAEGKMVRLWATPENEVVWQTLRNAGVDLLNADDLDRLQTFLTKP